MVKNACGPAITQTKSAINVPAALEAAILQCYYLTPLQLIPHQPRSQSLSGFSSPEADFIVHHGDERSLGAALFVAMEACTAGRYACTR